MSAPEILPGYSRPSRLKRLLRWVWEKLQDPVYTHCTECGRELPDGRGPLCGECWGPESCRP